MKYYKYLPYILFPVYLFLLLTPLLAGHFHPKWDASDMGYPSFVYLADSLREGRFPLWDPYTNCGYPFHADAGFVFNIPAILIGLLINNASFGFVLLWVIYWAWAGLGMIWLARDFGASPTGAFLAGLAYSLSGFFIGHAQHSGFILTAAWLPWIFGLADKAVREQSMGYALLCGAAAGSCALGGYPGFTVFLELALLLWLGLRHRPLKWTFIVLFITGAVMLAVWSPALNAFFTEGRGYTERVSQLDPHLANFDHPFPIAALVSLFFPFATFIFPSLVQADVAMTNAYVGLLTVPLAAVWFVTGRMEKRRSWALVIFALFMFILSLGGQAGLRILLYYIYPPIRFMRFSAPFRIFWMLPVSVAAGLGFTYLEKHPEKRRLFLKIFFIWIAIGLCAGVAVAIFCASDGIEIREVFKNLYLPAMITAVLAAPLLWYWSKGRQGALYKIAPVLITLVVLADMSMHLYNNSFTVFTDDDIIERVEAMRVSSTHVDGEPGPRRPEKIAGFMNVQQVTKTFIAPGYMTMKSKGFDEVLLNSRFLEVLGAPYRFWISPGVTHAVSRESALDVLAGTGAGEPVTVFVEDVGINLPDARAIPGAFGAARITSYNPEKVEVEAGVPEPGGFLASTERYAAGWKAFVDGKEQRVYKTNLYFRGIYLSPGRHSVIWKYEPRLWKALVLFSFVSLTAAFAAGVYLSWKKEGRG